MGSADNQGVHRTMRVMVIGNGSREHAIAWKLKASPRVDEVYVAPGNAGTAKLGVNVSVSPTDVDGLLDAARAHAIDLTVVGPEMSLEAGVVDAFEARGLRIVGPTQAAARIETSKTFAKRLMERHGIPTARAEAFTSYGEAREYVTGMPGPVVIKADGLAAGKGVRVCESTAEALDALHEAMEERVFGDAGRRVLVEERLVGQEISVFTFTDGVHLSPLVAACDYKRIGDGDVGLNTGGMGAYSPPLAWTAELETQVMAEVMEPAVRALAAEGCPFRGMLYGGLMLTEDGPKVIEFNARLGDPETQAVLPRMESDLLDVFEAIVDGRVGSLSIAWSPQPAVGVVMASGGYPEAYSTGHVITGLDAVDEDVAVFHAGTALSDDGGVVTAGGRVLTVAAVGDSMEAARARAYENAARIGFEGAQYRRDIAAFAPAASGR